MLSGSPDIEPAAADHQHGPAGSAARQLMTGSRTFRLIDLSSVPLTAAAFFSAGADDSQITVHDSAWLAGAEHQAAVAAAIETSRYAREGDGVDIGFGCVSNGTDRLVVATSDTEGSSWREFDVSAERYQTAVEVLFWMLAVAHLGVV